MPLMRTWRLIQIFSRKVHMKNTGIFKMRLRLQQWPGQIIAPCIENRFAEERLLFRPNSQGFTVEGQLQFPRHVFGYHVFVSRRFKQRKGATRAQAV
jgi:hypothetical protein